MFKIKTEDKKSKARVGLIKTLHGVIETPCFVPDATYGAVKHLSVQELEGMNLPMILGNIYHLSIRPGIKNIAKMGGLHEFMNWKRPIITDSGGFQVFSLIYRNRMGKIYDNRVEFYDHLTGDKHLLTPQKSIESRLNVDSDILMVLDYPVSPFAGANDIENIRSVKLTARWAKKGKDYFNRQEKSKGRIIMGIIQGGGSKELRLKSYQSLCTQNFTGYGFGGLPLDFKILAYTAGLIPDSKIRYVLGGGTPIDILKSAAMGWDLFDCVIPTRNARHGLLYTFSGEIRIGQEKYKFDKKPPEKNCPCTACRNGCTRAYIRHLFKVKEPLASRLATLHNLTFYTRFMEKIRENIEKGEFEKFKREFEEKTKS